MSNTQKEVALPTNNGTPTPFSFLPAGISDAEKTEIGEAIKAAVSAKPEEFTDVTPLYWEAKRGESKVLQLRGFKVINRTDEKTGEVTQDFAVVFHDGEREIVMNQISIKDAMKSQRTGNIFKITCTESAAGKAKKFDVLKYNQ